MPRRVSRFTAWLRAGGEPQADFVGDNWYEVERAAAAEADGGHRRAAFTLDELPPTGRRVRDLAALARAGARGAGDRRSTRATRPRRRDLLDAIERQDVGFVRDLGGGAPELSTDPIDRLYAARDALTDALEAAGPSHDGVRRMLRLAIADDLRAAEALRPAGVIDLATAAPKRLRHTGEWPTPAPRRAAPGTELRALQDAMPRCADGGDARPVGRRHRARDAHRPGARLARDRDRAAVRLGRREAAVRLARRRPASASTTSASAGT